ncbi:hypothetical protein EXN65_20035 [Clostridium botulinum]|nr:hypothetical protein [Clostridium botulinum]NFE32698.1 hypothetical protein [Clostridium botulinum]
MNRRNKFLIGIAIIWIFFLLKIGANIFGVGLAVVFSVLWFAIYGGWCMGTDKSKQIQYFANKYDEEYRDKKES